LSLGYPHPDYLLKCLTSRQISEWIAYFKIEPFGPPAEEMRFGVLAASTLLPHVKKGTKIDPRDFTVSLKPETKNKPDADLGSQLKSAFKTIKAIPSREWSRKKKRRKTKEELG
jgi:hypothetical protein